jgi:hypothetical protein
VDLFYAHCKAAMLAARQYPLPVLREVCRRPGESDLSLHLRLVEAGWSPRAVIESLQPASAGMIRNAVRSIAREIRKIGRVDAQGIPVQPNWDLIAMSLWRATDRWVGDSTKDASFLGRLWKKIRLLDSMAETTSSGAAGGYEVPLGARPQGQDNDEEDLPNTPTRQEVEALFPGADKSMLDRMFLTAYGRPRSSASLRGSRETGSTSSSSLTASKLSSPEGVTT